MFAEHNPGQAMVEHQAGELERLPGPISDGCTVSVGSPDGKDQALSARLRRAIDEVREAVAVQIDAALIKSDETVTVAKFGEDLVGFIRSDCLDVTTEWRGFQRNLSIAEVLRKASRVLVVCRISPLDPALADPDARDLHGRA